MSFEIMQLEDSDPVDQTEEEEIEDRMFERPHKQWVYKTTFKNAEEAWIIYFIKKFIFYFKKEWIKKHSGWYEGYMPLNPSTNNGLESINATIKKEHTLRQRLALALFLKVKIDIVKAWSTDRDPQRRNHKSVKMEPDIKNNHTLNVMAYHLKKSKVHTLIMRENDLVHYFVNASKNMTKEDKKKLKLLIVMSRNKKWINVILLKAVIAARLASQMGELSEEDN
jgi:hypothetical protein